MIDTMTFIAALLLVVLLSGIFLAILLTILRVVLAFWG